jgi:hypothetical protein
VRERCGRSSPSSLISSLSPPPVSCHYERASERVSE